MDLFKESDMRSSIGGPTESTNGGQMNELKNFEGFCSVSDNRGGLSDNRGVPSLLGKILSPNIGKQKSAFNLFN
jgi:hypothetical protein